MDEQTSTLNSRATLERVLAVARIIGQSANLAEILQLVIDAMRDTLDAERATVFQFDPARKELFTTVAHGLDSTPGPTSTTGIGATPTHGSGATPTHGSGAPSGTTPNVSASPGHSAGSIDSTTTPEAPVASPARQIRIPIGVGIAGQAAASRAIINIPDAYADPRFNAEVDRRTGFRTRSILTIPLIAHDGELIGVSQVLNKRGSAFTQDDEALAAALASQAAVAIRRGRLIEDRVVRERLERDLQVARSIQQQTFPRILPVAPGFEIAAIATPADETGGDAYDIVGFIGGMRDTPGAPPGPGGGAAAEPTKPGEPADEIAFLLGDATGHGIGPALSATQTRAMLRMAIRLRADLAGLVRHINQQLCEDLPASRFVTAWFGRLNVKTAVLEGLSAGQGPLLLYRAATGHFIQIEPGGVPLGIMEDWEYDPPFSISLEPGDIFIALTDGFFEAPAPRPPGAASSGGPGSRPGRIAADRRFGLEGVTEALRPLVDRSPEEMLETLVRTLNRFTEDAPPEDDRTGIILKRVR